MYFVFEFLFLEENIAITYIKIATAILVYIFALII